jgi:hypothetical protein
MRYTLSDFVSDFPVLAVRAKLAIPQRKDRLSAL